MAAGKTGTLVIAGSGIASVSQMTLETVNYITTADKVYYLLTDPVTENFVRDKNNNSLDLKVFYDSEKPRHESYLQMSEIMLRDVRKGLKVVGVFYGHPGVFVAPSHRAISIARDEGYSAKMLPGISAEDCLFADIGVDPAVPGCLTFEATDFLVRDRPVSVSSSLILWQVGCIGISDMKFSNDKMPILLDRLEQEYGPNHTVIHYIGATLPQEDPVVDKLSISELRKPEVACTIKPRSTFYILPLRPAESNKQICKALGLSMLLKTNMQQMSVASPFKLSGLDMPTVDAYTSGTRALLQDIDQITATNNNPTTRTSRAMQTFMERMALDPALLAKYKQDPVGVVDGESGLSALEERALKSRSSEAIRDAMDVNHKRHDGDTTGAAAPDFRQANVVIVIILASLTENVANNMDSSLTGTNRLVAEVV